DVGFRRFPTDAHFSSSGDWASSSLAFALSCGSPDTSPSSSSRTVSFLACFGRLYLSALGKPLDPRTFLQVLPGWTRDVTQRLAAHTGRASFPASGSLVFLMSARWCSAMGCHVALLTANEGFPLTGCHNEYP